MKILMTGSHGFVGTNLIEALGTTYHIIRWNVGEDKPLPECDVVIHLAGLAHDTKRSKTSEGRWKKEDYFRVNTELTKRIYDRFLESSAKMFIFFSSIKAQDGDTAYAVSKREAELAISQKEEVRRKKGKEAYILRPCMIHGKGNKGNLNLLVKWVKKGFPWPLAAFENRRSFASMGNVVFVISELMNKDVESGTYNICDDEAVSTNELIELICQSMGRKAYLLKIPQGLIKGIARVGDTLHLPLNTERLRKLTENYIISNRDIKLALGEERMPVEAKEGLRESIRRMIEE